ncbi:MAG: D-alanyl-D-alanine carboxypeptidase/D-alanyl-D-alanine-endopeptidase [Aquabacterium sp.]
MTRLHMPPCGPSAWRRPLQVLGAALVGGAMSLTAQAQGSVPSSPPSPSSPPLPAAISEALKMTGLPAQAVSMVVWPVDAATPRLDHLGQLSRQPASVMKLFTTGSALVSLGPAFTWRTDAGLGGPLSAEGRLAGPLYLRGSGDPSLVLENLWLMMLRWRAAGLHDIQGGIVIDRSAFDLPAHDPAAFDASPLKPYNAGPDALMLNHQAVTLRFMRDSARPDRIRVTMEPELAGVRLDNQVKLLRNGECGNWREGLDIDLSPDEHTAHQTDAQSGAAPWTLRVRGPYPANCQTREWPLLWQGNGPGDHAARLLQRLWTQAGGHVGGTLRDGQALGSGEVVVRPGTWPADVTVWQTWVSAPLGKVVQDINKFSNNVMARHLFLSLSPPPGPATLEKARQAVASQVRAATPDARWAGSPGRSMCDGDALVLDNGSGLSREERASADCLARWIQAMWASPMMPEFLASLPVSGVDGTARRMNGASGRAHVKTGSLEGVSAIAGIVLGDSGQRHIVVAIVNHPQAQAARPVMEALLGWAMRDRGDQN